MAELVQLRIENTIPELEQMERIGLFTNKEIKHVVRQRKTREYRLQRRHKTKDDYLKYIEYETSLLKLIHKRREKTKNFNKKNEIDNSIAKRINKLFKAAIVRCQKDVDLWLAHIDFCKKMHWNDTISGMFSRLLQVHNNNPALWIKAAKWEMEENSAPDNARSLFQRGLRFHPESKLLWQEYFEMELKYIDQLHKRKEKLELEIEDDEAVLQGKIPIVIYSNAIDVITDVNFAISFLPICEKFDFTKSIEDEIYNNLEQRFADKEETVDCFAKKSLRNLQENWKKSEISESEMLQLEMQVFNLYEDAIQKNSTEKLWTLYIQLCLNLIQKIEKLAKQILIFVLNLMEKASNEGHLSEELFVEWVKLLNSCQKKEECLSAVNKLAQKWSNVVSHWLLCITLHIDNGAPMKSVMAIFNESISHVLEKESLPLWHLAIEWIIATNPSKVKSLFERGVYMCSEVSVLLKCSYLEYEGENDNIKVCRKLYNRLKNLKPLSVEFFKKMIKIEYFHLKSPSIKRLRKIYEDAILEFGVSSADIWLDYMKLELTHKKGTPAEVGNIYWRAVKNLEDEKTDLFITSYTLLSNSHCIPKYNA